MSKWGQAVRTAVSALIILLFGGVCWVRGHESGIDETYEDVWDDAYYYGQQSVEIEACNELST